MIVITHEINLVRIISGIKIKMFVRTVLLLVSPDKKFFLCICSSNPLYDESVFVKPFL